MTTNKFKYTIHVHDTFIEEETNLFFCGCNDGKEAIRTPVFTESAEDYSKRVKKKQEEISSDLAYYHGLSRHENDITKCPNCGSKVTMNMRAGGTWKSYAAYSKFEYAKVYDNGHLISLSYGYGQYIYNGDVQKIGYQHKRTRLTFNATTGFTYLLSGKKIRNITYTFGESKAMDGIRWMAQEGYQDQVDEFFELCKERRGLKFVEQSRFEGGENQGTLPLLLKFPVLENFPTYRLGWMPAKYRKPLSQMTKVTDVFELFIGTSAKSVRKKLKNASAINFYRTWSLGIQDPNNLLKLVDAEYATYRGTHTPTIFMDNPDNPYGNGPDAPDCLDFALEHFANGDETVLVNRILNEKVETYNNKLRKMEIVPELPTRTLSLIQDIERMYAELKAALPDYELRYRTSFRAVHDRMIVEHSRLRNKNLLIPYAEEETERYNQVIGEIEFRLAETTDRLRDIGRKLDICVGGYSSYAMQKKTTIVQAYYQEKYIICLEVVDGRLIQAKTPYNHTPNEELVKVVKTWCDAADVSYANAHDLEGGFDETIESIMRNPAADEDILTIPDYEDMEEEAIQPAPVYQGQRGYAQPAYMPNQQPPAQVAEDPFEIFGDAEDLPF